MESPSPRRPALVGAITKKKINRYHHSIDSISWAVHAARELNMTLHPIPSHPNMPCTSLFPSKLTFSVTYSNILLVPSYSYRDRGGGGKQESGKKTGKEWERREGAWASARYWCIKRAYLRSLFSRMWTPGMRRSREEGNRAPDCITSAIYLFYPGGWIKLVYGTRTPERRARV